MKHLDEKMKHLDCGLYCVNAISILVCCKFVAAAVVVLLWTIVISVVSSLTCRCHHSIGVVLLLSWSWVCYCCFVVLVVAFLHWFLLLCHHVVVFACRVVVVVFAVPLQCHCIVCCFGFTLSRWSPLASYRSMWRRNNVMAYCVVDSCCRTHHTIQSEKRCVREDGDGLQDLRVMGAIVG